MPRRREPRPPGQASAVAETRAQEPSPRSLRCEGTVESLVLVLGSVDHHGEFSSRATNRPATGHCPGEGERPARHLRDSKNAAPSRKWRKRRAMRAPSPARWRGSSASHVRRIRSGSCARDLGDEGTSLSDDREPRERRGDVKLHLARPQQSAEEVLPAGSVNVQRLADGWVHHSLALVTR